MKCPNDQTEMEYGILRGYLGVMWKEQKFLGKSKSITAWRCPKCGKIELYSEVESEPEKK